jgi:hypothetical protein
MIRVLEGALRHKLWSSNVSAEILPALQIPIVKKQQRGHVWPPSGIAFALYRAGTVAFNGGLGRVRRGTPVPCRECHGELAGRGRLPLGILDPRVRGNEVPIRSLVFADHPAEVLENDKGGCT